MLRPALFIRFFVLTLFWLVPLPLPSRASATPRPVPPFSIGLQLKLLDVWKSIPVLKTIREIECDYGHIGEWVLRLGYCKGTSSLLSGSVDRSKGMDGPIQALRNSWSLRYALSIRLQRITADARTLSGNAR